MDSGADHSEQTALLCLLSGTSVLLEDPKGLGFELSSAWGSQGCRDGDY